MSNACALAARPVALQLHALLGELDPARWHEEAHQSLLAHMEELERLMVALLDAIEHRRNSASPDAALTRLRERIAEIEEVLKSQTALLKERTQRSRDDWMAFRARLSPAYDQLAEVLLAEAIHVPRLRPTNYRRNLLHILSGFVAFASIQQVPSSLWLIGIAGSFFVYAWLMEWVRRASPAFNEQLMAFYGPVAHAHEWHRINSATWYCTALLILALTGSTLVCSIAVLVLGVGDPAAALIGRRWGRTKLLNGRSLEGSATFVATATLVTAAFLVLFRADVTMGQALGLAFIGALAGALAELVSSRIDDNLTIPVASGLAVYAASILILAGG